jgi:FkbM family methyltransferase
MHFVVSSVFYYGEVMLVYKTMQMLPKGMKTFLIALLKVIAKIFPEIAKDGLRLFEREPYIYSSMADILGIQQGLTLVVPDGPLKDARFENLFALELIPVRENQMEPNCVEALERLSLIGSTVIDVGASYGFYSVLFSRFVGPQGTVYAIEPDIQTFIRLTRNLELNACSNVIPISCALSDKRGYFPWASSEDQPWSSQFLSNEKASWDANSRNDHFAVPVLMLDDFLPMTGELHIALVKIDVEGAEAKVLQGARRLLGEARPIMLIELHNEENADRVWGFLKGVSYSWKTVEYVSSSRHHIMAFPDEIEREGVLLLEHGGQ